ELRGKLGIFDSHQGLTLLNDGAFLHQDRADDATFEALDHLGLLRRHDTAVAALDLVQHRKMRPYQKSGKKREEREQQHAGGTRCPQRSCRPDVVRKGKVRGGHCDSALWLLSMLIWVGRYSPAREPEPGPRVCP